MIHVYTVRYTYTCIYTIYISSIFIFKYSSVQCPEDTPVLGCGLNYCNFLTCPESPDAECIMDVCGQCEARFYINDEEVTDSCSKWK